MSSIPGQGRSSGVGNGNPPEYSCLENSMGTWIFCSPDGLQSMGSQRVRHDWACTCGDGGRDWSGVSTSQGMSRTTGKLQELVGRTLLYRSQIDLNSVDPCQTRSLQNCGTMNFCCFQPLRLWHFVTGKLVHQYPIFVQCPQAGVILISSLNLS